MRISDRYIGKQVLSGTVFAVLLLSVILVLGSLFREIRPLLVEQKIPPSLVAKFALNILPFSLVFTIPWGFLSAVMLVFGRLSSDHELTSFRVAGVSLPRLAAPVFAISLILVGVCLWLNLEVAPRSKASMENLLYEEGMRNPRALLDPGAVRSRFKNQKVFIEGRDGDALIGFHMYQIKKEKDPDSPPSAYVHAGRVELLVDDQKKEFRLTLDNSYIETRDEEGNYSPAFAGEAKYWYLGFSDSRPKKPKASAMTESEIRKFAEELRQKNFLQGRVQALSEITRRYAYSMASFAFAFVGVPLALKSRRRDTSSGLLLSIAVAAGYFLFGFIADQFKSESEANLALWAPNVICVLLGLWLFRRARFK